MSYCRISDDSDVYVYGSRDCLVCCACGGTGFEAKTYSEMIDHLKKHIRDGHKVPQRALDNLESDKEVNGDEYK